jgi:uncharacterized repeat protein (TIGR01451 family)
MAFVDALPSGLILTAAPPTNTCGGTLTASPGNGSATLTGGVVPAFSSCSVSVGVTANSAGHYLNTMPASSIGTNQGNTNAAPATAALDVTAPQLRLSIDDAQAYVRYGATPSYTITVNNVGSAAANGVSVAQTLSAAFDAANAQWSCVHANDGTQCSAAGTGPVSDSNVVIPPALSIAYVVNATVLVQAAGDTADTSVTVTAPGDPASPLNTADSDVLILFRDDFE